MDPIVETWNIAARLNPYMIDAVAPEHWSTKPTKGKTVEGHFCHIHNVRLMWLKEAAPDLLIGLEKLESGSPEAVKLALEASAAAIATMLERAAETNRIKGFKPHRTAYLGYLISHETHHRAQAELILREFCSALPDKVAYGLWEWGVR